jgi:hypothetical protein
MAEPDKPLHLTRTRLFLLIFFGIAILLSITTILGTWDEQKNGVMSQTDIDSLAGKTPAK